MYNKLLNSEATSIAYKIASTLKMRGYYPTFSEAQFRKACKITDDNDNSLAVLTINGFVLVHSVDNQIKYQFTTNTKKRVFNLQIATENLSQHIEKLKAVLPNPAPNTKEQIQQFIDVTRGMKEAMDEVLQYLITDNA